MDGDKSSIMVMEPPSPQCVGECNHPFDRSVFHDCISIYSIILREELSCEANFFTCSF